MPRILFVCTGNICRSPMAEGIARDRAASDDLTFASAGTYAIVGSGATGMAEQTAAEIGVDIGGHVARQATAELMNEAEHVYGLTAEHVEWLALRFPEADIELLDPAGDIEDPYGMELEDYRVARQRIVDAIEARRDDWR